MYLTSLVFPLLISKHRYCSSNSYKEFQSTVARIKYLNAKLLSRSQIRIAHLEKCVSSINSFILELEKFNVSASISNKSWDLLKLAEAASEAERLRLLVAEADEKAKADLESYNQRLESAKSFHAGLKDLDHFTCAILLNF